VEEQDVATDAHSDGTEARSEVVAATGECMDLGEEEEKGRLLIMIVKGIRLSMYYAGVGRA
jgi:hypothetical protein